MLLILVEHISISKVLQFFVPLFFIWYLERVQWFFSVWRIEVDSFNITTDVENQKDAVLHMENSLDRYVLVEVSDCR